MKYKLIGKNNYFDVLETVLNNRGITDVKRYLKASNNKDEEHHYSLLKNIDKAVDCIVNHIEKDSKIFIQIDSDFDGQVSAAMTYLYLKQLKPNLVINWRNQTGKQHGIKSEYVSDGVGLVIVPDAGSNDTYEHRKLKERGIDVVVIDHHEIEKESEYAIVVNNQDGQYPNRHLSGSGVVYKTLQALDDKLRVDFAEEYLDLTALGLISDMMSMIDYENRYYVHQGLSNINNLFFKELFKEQEYSIKGIISPTNVSFFIAPLVNATIRAGSKEEKDQMFRAIIDDGTSEVFYERKKENESLIKNTIRMMKRVRQQQNKEVDASVEVIREKIEEKNLLDNKILIVDVGDSLDKNYTGLVANRLLNSNDVKRPVMLLRYNQQHDSMSGSARGYSKGHIKDFKQFIEDSGYFSFQAGHSNAFGCSTSLDKLIEFNEYVNEKYKDVDFGSSEYEVDFIIPSKNLQSNVIREIDNNKHLWGREVDEPIIAIEKVEVERRRIGVIGQNKNVIKFGYKGIEYIKFGADKSEVDALTSGSPMDMLTFNVIGKCSINEFRGNKTPQIIIEDYEIVETKERKLIF